MYRVAPPCLAVLALALAACARPEQPPRVVVIGVDGGSWNLLEPAMRDGKLPAFAALAERGVTADLATVEPVFSPVVWTSIATGRTPAAHGVDFFYANRRSIRVPTMWERFAGAGLRVGLQEWLVTWPPRDLPGGYVIPGWLRRDRAVSPPDLWTRIGAPESFYEVVEVGSLADVVANVERELEAKPATFRRLWETFQPEVAAVTFYAVDVVCHRFYHTAAPGEFPAPVETDPRFADVVGQTLAGVDRGLAEIVATLGPRDHILVVSDHGFRAAPEIPHRWAFDSEFLLDRLGVAPGREPVTIVTDWMQVVIRIEPGPDAERQPLVDRLARGLADVRREDGTPVFEVRVVSRPERATEAEHPRPLLRLVRSQLPAHSFVVARPAPELRDRVPDGRAVITSELVPLSRFAAVHAFTGEHDPVGIFLAAGPAIRRRPGRARLSVLDVAPLVTYLAGQPIPDDYEGRLHTALLDPPWLGAHPPTRVRAAEAPKLPAEPGDAAPAGQDPELERRLKALGYVE